MKNLNINLTSDQAKLVEKEARRRGFANRSEFFRALIRYVFFYSPQTLEKLDTAVFAEPPVKDINQIKSDLEKSGKYNKKFIESLTAGLEKSEYFSK